ncbi:hypothetical protein THAOC_00980, partial [Thalassiosira oceanica]
MMTTDPTENWRTSSFEAERSGLIKPSFWRQMEEQMMSLEKTQQSTGIPLLLALIGMVTTDRHTSLLLCDDFFAMEGSYFLKVGVISEEAVRTPRLVKVCETGGFLTPRSLPPGGTPTAEASSSLCVIQAIAPSSSMSTLVGVTSFAHNYFQQRVTAVQSEADALTANIPDIQTRLRIFHQCTINKLPFLLGTEVLHNLPLTDDKFNPADWMDWYGPLSQGVDQQVQRFLGALLGMPADSVSAHALTASGLDGRTPEPVAIPAPQAKRPRDETAPIGPVIPLWASQACFCVCLPPVRGLVRRNMGGRTVGR